MSDIENLPDEMLVQLCESMMVEQLVKFVQTDKKVNDVCYKTLERKKKEYIRNLYPFTNLRFPDILEQLYNDSHLDTNEFYQYHSDEDPSEYQGLILEHVYFRGNLQHAILAFQKYIYDNLYENFIDKLINNIESAFDIQIPLSQLYENLLNELQPNDYTQFYLKKIDPPIIIDDPEPISYKYIDNRFPSILEELLNRSNPENRYFYIHNEVENIEKGTYFKGNQERVILSLQRYFYEKSGGNSNLIDSVLSKIPQEDDFMALFSEFIDVIDELIQYADGFEIL